MCTSRVRARAGWARGMTECGLDGEPAASLDALYEVAALARVRYEEIITEAAGGVTLLFAPLKGRRG